MIILFQILNPDLLTADYAFPPEPSKPPPLEKMVSPMLGPPRDGLRTVSFKENVPLCFFQWSSFRFQFLLPSVLCEVRVGDRGHPCIASEKWKFNNCVQRYFRHKDHDTSPNPTQLLSHKGSQSDQMVGNYIRMKQNNNNKPMTHTPTGPDPTRLNSWVGWCVMAVKINALRRKNNDTVP